MRECPFENLSKYDHSICILVEEAGMMKRMQASGFLAKHGVNLLGRAWETRADRLGRLRNTRNIPGSVRALSLSRYQGCEQ